MCLLQKIIILFSLGSMLLNVVSFFRSRPYFLALAPIEAFVVHSSARLGRYRNKLAHVKSYKFAVDEITTSSLGNQRQCSAQLFSHAYTMRGGYCLTPTRVMSASVEVSEAPIKTTPEEKFRKDYKPLHRKISEVEMDVDLELNGYNTVTTRLTFVQPENFIEDLILDGKELELQKIQLEGRHLVEGIDFKFTDRGLTIFSLVLPPQSKFHLETVVKIRPDSNSQLSGLYKDSDKMLCSQCEAEGFRRITYYQDRPDVMATFRKVTLRGNKTDFPVLLSNGNKVDEGMLENNRQYAVWSDPFPKPSYLFAIVAGNLASVSSSFTVDWAMESLKAAMKWDEETFGLEYDLDVFNIVAVNNFNMGAMENKSLNIFNTAYVLAKPETATDNDYSGIESVIGHEYFHNWTGNRVTCRDWFQLTLKEGLTVFRDQQFSADMGSAAVKRINSVVSLRARQFPEDSSPLAHPIRPEQYQVMDNFYTATVYEKGAEVIRMYHTLLGSEGFRKGMDLYFWRHDGQAVTCDDFRAAMADANNRDLTQFERWYSQAGTPTVVASGNYDSVKKTYNLTLKQSTKSTPNQEHKDPFHIPVSVGLLSPDGKEIVPTTVLELKAEEETFVFENVEESPIPSILRNFSAPVKLRFDYTDEDLAFLMEHDTDAFNKWEASQILSKRIIFNVLKNIKSQKVPNELPDIYVRSFRSNLLQSRNQDKSLQAYALSLPSISTLAEEMDVVDPDSLSKAVDYVKRSIATKLNIELKQTYSELTTAEPYERTEIDVGRRRLRNIVLNYLHALKDRSAVDLCYKQYEEANNMTDRLAAISCLSDISCEEREKALVSFYNSAKSDALVLNKWFAIQASCDLDDTLERVQELVTHPDFTLYNPNRVRALIGSFSANISKFHSNDGSGYRFIGDNIIALDSINAQVASRLAAVFRQWKKFDESRQILMKEELIRIRDSPGISNDTLEVVTRCLG